LPFSLAWETITLVNFEIVGEIEQIETIATGRRVKVRSPPEGAWPWSVAQEEGRRERSVAGRRDPAC
jgi:hypothetical protein